MKIRNCTNLNELFYEWKKAHECENDEEYNKYRVGSIGKSAFLNDGIIDEEFFGKNSNGKLLFLAKEANCGGETQESNGNFWIKDCINGKTIKTAFSKRLAMLSNAFYNNDYSACDKQNFDNLRYAALVNINKRGGNSYCSDDRLLKYAKKYAKFIAKEIEIINPSIIVCCSKFVYELYNGYIKQYINIELQLGIRVICVLHPSYYRISDNNYLKMFENAVKEKPFKIEKSAVNMPQTSKRGIIVNTNLRYEDTEFTEEMLSSEAPSIRIYRNDNGRNFLDRINTGDYIFYYLNGKGIIAVGKVLDTVTEYPDIHMKERQVELVVKPVKKDGDYVGCPVNSRFREKTKNDNMHSEKPKGFWLRNTLVRPYLYQNPDNDEVQKAIEYVEKHLHNSKE